MIRCDKTYSELWNLTESKNKMVAEAAHMAIKTIKELQEENAKYEQFISACRWAGEDGLPQLREDARDLLKPNA